MIPAGTRLGPYELSEMLGAGGMGEVYKARDTRLERSVAIKVLPPHLSSNPSLRERFEREAKTISAITHPNICALYDVGDAVVGAPRRGAREEDETDHGRATGAPLQESVQFLVMEYLEGESLAERLTKGPLPLEHVLRYGFEIASALDKAHRAGIIHRDLKPGNIMITKSGAKLLDFGLAKYAQPTNTVEGLTNLPTEQKPLTREGTILGTFQYMAPEQLAGEDADARTDIFALGAVLYEMLTGTRAFQGKNKTSLIGAIVSGEPRPISALQPLTPPALEHVIKKCLAKEPDDRWQSAHDIAGELKWISEAGSQAGVAAVPARGKRVHLSAAVIALGVATISFAAATLYYRQRLANQLVVRAAILPPEKGIYRFLGAFGPPAISSDGKRIVFAAAGEGKPSQLWVRPIDALEATPLAGTERASFPFWSPDGSAIAFFSQGKLKRIPAQGGPTLTLCDAPDARGGSWGKKNQIIFGGRNTPISIVPASGGVPRPVTSFHAGRGESSHRWPFFLPDGEHFLYLAAITGSQNEENQLAAGHIDGKLRKTIMQASTNVDFVDGHLFFAHGSALVAQKFDADELELLGEPIPLLDGLQYDAIFSQGIFSVSEEGPLLYQIGAARLGSNIERVDSTGKSLASIGGHEPYLGVSVSPDETAAVATIFDTQMGIADLWVLDLASGNKRRLTFGPRMNGFPVWLPDSRSILFASERTGKRDVYIKKVSGFESERLFLGDENKAETPSSVTPDGKYAIVTVEDLKAKTKSDVWLVPIEDPSKARPLLQSTARESVGRVSPDGKWIVYQSDESGHFEVYVSAFPSMQGKWQISQGIAGNAAWSADGKAIYYIAEDEKLMRVDVRTDASFVPGRAEPIMSPRWVPNQRSYVPVSSNEFVMTVIADDESVPPLNLVTNWRSMLPQ